MCCCYTSVQRNCSKLLIVFMDKYILVSILVVVFAVLFTGIVVSVILKKRKEGIISTDNRLKKFIISELLLLFAVILIIVIGLACGINLDIWKEIFSNPLVLSIFLWPIVPIVIITFSKNK